MSVLPLLPAIEEASISHIGMVIYNADGLLVKLSLPPYLGSGPISCIVV
jgi:hypothetical protein